MPLSPPENLSIPAAGDHRCIIKEGDDPQSFNAIDGILFL
jgi:hypothetical protein